MQFQVQSLLERAQRLEQLSLEEGLFLWHNASSAELMFAVVEEGGE